MERDFVLTCPIPITERKSIVMGHGSGGKLTAQLVHDLFLPAFDNQYLNKLDDQAVFQAGSARLAFTTDSFVVTPLFFPGGDIGELAVNGTVNDLAMSGARPLVPFRGLHHGRRFSDGRAVANCRFDGAGGASGGRFDRYRRHQGGKPGFGR